MVLTEKAEEHFQDWYTIKYNQFNICYEDEIHLYAMIIEWLDSIGIYIEISFDKPQQNQKLMKWWLSINGQEYDGDFNSRKQATKQAIIKAVEIYNRQSVG